LNQRNKNPERHKYLTKQCITGMLLIHEMPTNDLVLFRLPVSPLRKHAILDKERDLRCKP